MHERSALQQGQKFYSVEGVSLSALALYERIQSVVNFKQSAGTHKVYQLGDLINDSYLSAINHLDSYGSLSTEMLLKIIGQHKIKGYRATWPNFQRRNYSVEQIYTILFDKVILPEEREYDLLEALREVVAPLVPDIKL